MATNPTFTASAALKPVALAPQNVFVEVADKPTVAKVVREGFQVPPVTLDNQAATFFLDNLQVVPPRLTPRVVSQSVRPGTKVVAGTVIDLVLASADIIPFDIFDGVHEDLKGRNLSNLLDGILADAPTRQTLLKYEKAADVPQAEKTALLAKFTEADIGFNEEVPTLSFESAFNSSRAALAFK
jgi:hypothetical protein